MTGDGARAEREAFRQQRLAMLTGLGGSLSMVAVPAVPRTPATFEGLPGTWGLGEGADGVRVTAAAAEGVLVDGDLLDGTALLGPASGLRFSGTVTAAVAREVDGTWYLQVADTTSPNLAAFAGLEVYDHDPAWVLDAVHRSRPEAERATTAGRLGSDEQHRRDSLGGLEVTLDGRVHHLAVHASFVPGVVTISFTDETSGSETPSTGRVLVMPSGSDGPVVLDLDGAMLLPHESSPVHPCPTPPSGDHLPVAVRAGERAVRFDR